MEQKQKAKTKFVSMDRIILYLGIGLLLLLWFSTWHRISVESEIEKREAIRVSVTYGRSFADHVYHSVQNVDDALKIVRQHHQWLRNGSEEASVSQNFLQERVLSLAVADETGRVVAVYTGEEARKSVANEPFFKHHQQQAQDQLHSASLMTTEDSMLTWSRGIWDKAGVFRGVVFATSSKRALTEFLWELELESDAVLVVLGEDNTLRSWQPEALLEGKQEALGKFLGQQTRQQMEGYTGSFYDRSGEERIFHYYALESYPLIAATGVDVSQVKKDISERRQFYLLASLAVTLLISAVTALLVRRVKKEEALTRQVETFARQMASFQTITSHLVQDRDEVGDLLKTIITDAAQLMDAPDGYISVVDSKGNLEFPYAVGLYNDMKERKFDSTAGVSGQVLAQGKRQHIPDYQQVPDKLLEPELRQVSTVLMYPLSSGGRTLGVFGISWREKPFSPSEEQLSFLEQYAFLAAVALEKVQVKVQLREELKRSEEQQIDLQMAWRMLDESNRKLRMANEHLEEIALTDRLTGAWNRRKFEETAEQEMLRSQRYQEEVSILLIDIDFFKQINDEHGHLVGDQVLVEVVERIQQKLRVVDSIYRWGGEEFAVLLPCSTGEAAVAAAEKLRREVENKPLSAKKLRLTVSIGVAEFMSEDTLESWLKRVDDALYQAKKSGRNKVVLF